MSCVILIMLISMKSCHLKKSSGLCVISVLILVQVPRHLHFRHFHRVCSFAPLCLLFFKYIFPWPFLPSVQLVWPFPPHSYYHNNSYPSWDEIPARHTHFSRKISIVSLIELQRGRSSVFQISFANEASCCQSFFSALQYSVRISFYKECSHCVTLHIYIFFRVETSVWYVALTLSRHCYP